MLQQFANSGRCNELPSLYPLIQNAAKLSASGEVRARLKDTIDRLELAATEYRKLRSAFHALATHPNDPQAKTCCREILFAFRQHPAKGLSLLAKGPGPDSANPWRVLALRDMANPDVADEQASLADDWWTLAEQQSAPPRIGSRRGPSFGIGARPGLTGLAKTVAEKRLAAAPPQDSLARDYSAPPRHEVVLDPPSRPPQPNPRIPRVVIISARWGGGRRWSDVTVKVKQLFADDTLFYANPSTLGVDPTRAGGELRSPISETACRGGCRSMKINVSIHFRSRSDQRTLIELGNRRLQRATSFTYANENGTCRKAKC